MKTCKKFIHKLIKKLLGILVLVLFLITPSKADDIRDFQIEGMSIGDSALDYFSKSILEKNKELDWYKNKKFTPIAELKLSNSKTYESFQIAVKTNDKNYKIESIQGFIFYKNNIDECYEKLDDIAQEIKSVLGNVKDLGKKTSKHAYDKSGKSTVTDIILKDNRGNELSIQCYDWSDEFSFWDQLRISIDTKEHAYFLRYEAYE